MHRGFVDLNPAYRDYKKEIAVKKAITMTNLIGKNLLQKIETKARSNFKTQITMGRRLSLPSLGKLKSSWKKDYTDVITSELDQIIEENTQIKKEAQ